MKRITPDVADKIMALHSEGKSAAAIGKELGHTTQTICEVIRRSGGTVGPMGGHRFDGAKGTPPPESVTIRSLKRQLREREIQVARLEKTLDSRETFTEMIRESIDRVAPVKVPTFRPSGRRKPVSMIAMFSDFHVGLVVKANEVEGWNAYNWDICQRRAWRICNALVRWGKDEGAHGIDELVVLYLGDMLNGMLRVESLMYDEFEPPVQQTKVAYLMAENIRFLASHFPKVRVHALATDNHSRLTHKPLSSGRGKWSLSWSSHETVRVAIENLSNVSFENVESIKHMVTVKDHKFLCQHGNDIRGWNGLPFYGFRRALGNEALARMFRPASKFDYMLTAHFHDKFWLPHHLGNGCLCGISVYDHTNIRAARPEQWGLLVNKKYGVFNATPFLGDDPG